MAFVSLLFMGNVFGATSTFLPCIPVYHGNRLGTRVLDTLDGRRGSELVGGMGCSFFRVLPTLLERVGLVCRRHISVG